jgi:hypothetical protein
MTSTYKLNIGELSPDFIATLQKLYVGKVVEIMVREAEDDTGPDPTEYLLGSPENRRRLLAAVADIEKGEHLVSVPAEKLTP